MSHDAQQAERESAPLRANAEDVLHCLIDDIELGRVRAYQSPSGQAFLESDCIGEGKEIAPAVHAALSHPITSVLSRKSVCKLS